MRKAESTTAESYRKANLHKWYLNTLQEKDLPFSMSLSTGNPRVQFIPSIGHPPFSSASAYISQDEQLKQPIGTYYGTKRLGCSQNVCAQQTETETVIVMEMG
ncbi:transcription factor bHLH90-like isoform X2 [Gossypium australe]|uniref:Transcription factor bHLH90-like isoform X2 n=1 Tax=Gossypium australe TaxID=47621 RepID=A0A5B6V0G5_9ROSI|nr:transcription factor bHLH90-like isoform X2 [Gossypium australe]